MKIMMICLIHGKLDETGVIRKGKTNAGTQQYRCKVCYREMRASHYQNNKAKILADNHARRTAEPEKYAKIKADSRRKHIEKHRDKERIRHRILNRKARAELHDWYVKKVLTKRTELRNCDIPQGLVNLKKATIRMERRIKKIKEEIKHDEVREIFQ